MMTNLENAAGAMPASGKRRSTNWSKAADRSPSILQCAKRLGTGLIVALPLTLAAAGAVTVTSSMIYAPEAQAWGLSDITGAAKKVGGAVKRAAKRVGKDVKNSSKIVGRNAKDWGTSVGAAAKDVARGAKKTGKFIGGYGSDFALQAAECFGSCQLTTSPKYKSGKRSADRKLRARSANSASASRRQTTRNTTRGRSANRVTRTLTTEQLRRRAAARKRYEVLKPGKTPSQRIPARALPSPRKSVSKGASQKIARDRSVLGRPVGLKKSRQVTQGIKRKQTKRGYRKLTRDRKVQRNRNKLTRERQIKRNKRLTRDRKISRNRKQMNRNGKFKRNNRKRLSRQLRRNNRSNRGFKMRRNSNRGGNRRRSNRQRR